MANGKRMVAIAIGVRKPERLRCLQGAVNGAHSFFEWADALGYEATLITDETEPVTVARLRAELEAILPPKKPPIRRLVLYFAGHGLIRGAEEGIWLLSDWHTEQEAVAVEVLKRRLGMYHDIEQIAIFSDSCRSWAADSGTADLDPSGVLGSTQTRQETMPPIDKFIAAQDGAETYMIPGDPPAEDRCLFSGVLMEGLWGINPAAFSENRKKVTSQSLGAFLRSEAPKVAQRYKLKLNPNVTPTFPEGADVYFYEGQPPNPPTFPPWPPPPASPPSQSGPGGDGLNVESADFIIDEPAKISVGLDEDPKGASLLRQLRNQPRPQAFETQSGFATEGEPIRTVWTTSDVFAEIHGQANWWRVGQHSGYTLQNPTPLLVEFEDGLFAATTGLPQFIASILRDRRGVSAVVYREIHAPASFADPIERAIARMEEGALRADAKTDIAVELRQGKHADPVLGVICAYLYDSIGDTESVRRMAYYYIQHRQPIPYDIALLAMLRGDWLGGNVLARVPAVPGRKPRTEAERRHEWTYEATPNAEGLVGGLWPWLRQGWAFLDDPDDNESTLIKPGLVRLRQHLTSGRFTTLNEEGGHKLIDLFGLIPNR